MNTNEKAEATAAIGMMLKAFPSSQSSITADSAKVYLYAVEDFSLEAVKRACRQYVRGEVKGHNNAFAPSAPEMAALCRVINGDIIVEQFQAANRFIEEGSAEWAKLMIHRGQSSMPTFEKDGRKGWFFKAEEVEAALPIALPPPVSPARIEQMKEIVRGRIDKLGDTAPIFEAGDDAPDGDMGEESAA